MSYILKKVGKVYHQALKKSFNVMIDVSGKTLSCFSLIQTESHPNKAQAGETLNKYFVNIVLY